MKKKYSLRFIGILAMLAFCFVHLVTPSYAYADSYSIEKVNIDASLDKDGMLTVVEDRTYHFDGDFNGVYWLIPTDDVEKNYAHDVTIKSCGLLKDGKFNPFLPVREAEEGRSGVYTCNLTHKDSASVYQVKVFSPQGDGDATFRIVYRVAHAATAYKDTAELYWKFVSDGWDRSSLNVRCAIRLPYPKGANVKADVRAWGHGPLSGDVEITDYGVLYQISKVAGDEYAEARVVFPVSWLSHPETQLTSSQAGLEKILQEEQKWADEANAKREMQRAQIAFMRAAILVGTILCTIGMAILALMQYKKVRSYKSAELYFRDVPSQDHPAVLSMLFHGKLDNSYALLASVMRLCDMGVLALEQQDLRGGKPHFFLRGIGREVPLAKSDAKTYDIDVATLALLKNIACAAGRTDVDSQEPLLYFDDMKSVAARSSEEYAQWIEDWRMQVTKQFIATGYTKKGSVRIRVCCQPLVVVLALVLFPMASFSLQQVFVGNTFYLLPLGFAIIAWVILMIDVFGMSRLPFTAKGTEVYGKTCALRKWLLDFTRLNESIPQDIMLWNKLMVMAVALGVADTVIKNLKVAAPEIYGDEAFIMSYWYLSSYNFSASRMFTQASAQADHSVVENLGSASSGEGFGGGFSGGGGGGFGGGGGGGAF